MGNSNPFSSMFGGGSSSSSSSPTGNPFTGELGNLAATETGYGADFSSGGLDQYEEGVSGTLTPAQRALTGENLTEADLATNAGYGNLGLGMSTMNTQDQNFNALSSLSQQEAIDFQNEQAGMNAAQVGQGYFGQAGSELGSAGTQYNTGYSTAKQGINNLFGGSGGGILGGLLGNNSAGSNTGSNTSGTGGILSSILGGNSSAANQTYYDSGTFCC